MIRITPTTTPGMIARRFIISSGHGKTTEILIATSAESLRTSKRSTGLGGTITPTTTETKTILSGEERAPAWGQIGGPISREFPWARLSLGNRPAAESSCDAEGERG